uniref:Uncharacterized protein n=1 Tax=Anguilla anguilla TaxID=7936 RepID=A0A0E9R1D4_ANGAN
MKTAATIAINDTTTTDAITPGCILSCGAGGGFKELSRNNIPVSLSSSCSCVYEVGKLIAIIPLSKNSNTENIKLET